MNQKYNSVATVTLGPVLGKRWNAPNERPWR